jgi:hypothetical protein
MVSFRVDSLETAEITATTIEIEPCAIRRRAPRIDANAGTTTAYLVRLRIRFIRPVEVVDTTGVGISESLFPCWRRLLLNQS